MKYVSDNSGTAPTLKQISDFVVGQIRSAAWGVIAGKIGAVEALEFVSRSNEIKGFVAEQLREHEQAPGSLAYRAAPVLLPPYCFAQQMTAAPSVAEIPRVGGVRHRGVLPVKSRPTTHRMCCWRALEDHRVVGQRPALRHCR